jgi:hypothetical protein
MHGGDGVRTVPATATATVELTNVDAADVATVELVSVLLLASQHPSVIVREWRVDAYAAHYNLIFQLHESAGPVTDAHLQMLRGVNFVRIPLIAVSVDADGFLQVLIQVGRAASPQLLSEEHTLHVSRLCAVQPPGADRLFGRAKRARTDGEIAPMY